MNTTLSRRTTSDKIFCDKSLVIASNLQYDRYQRWISSLTSLQLFDKRSRDTTTTHIGTELFLRINNWLINYPSSSLKTLKLESRTLSFHKNCFICFKKNPLIIYFILKAFFFLRYLNFSLDFLITQKNQLDEKNKVSFIIYDVRIWLTNNSNTHIGQYLTT